MTIRDTIINLIGGKQLQAQRMAERAAIDELWNAYQMGKFRNPPGRLEEQLREYSSTQVLALVRQAQAGLGATSGFSFGDSEEARQYMVHESRQQWLYSPLAQWSVNTWTSYGLGEKVTVTCSDEKAQAIWAAVWKGSTIFDDDRLHDQSDYTCVEGERFFVAFISIADGTVTFSTLDSAEICEIVTAPGNLDLPLYYKRTYNDLDAFGRTLYYPDWHTFFYHPEALEKYTGLPDGALVTTADSFEENNGTVALVLHSAHNRKDPRNLRGWPILGIAAPYLGAHKEYIESRLSVARQKQMFVRELITKGGSRGVNAIKNKFDSTLGTSTTGSYTGYADGNPPAGAGSTLVHNEALEHKDMPMTTGAGDATADNSIFAHMALIGAGLFPATAGMDVARYATAVQMDKAQAVQWSKYQSFWAAQFRKMVELVLAAAEKWGSLKVADDNEIQVSIDTLSLVDFPDVVPPIAAIMTVIDKYVTSNIIPVNAAKELTQDLLTPVLSALGAEDMAEVLSDEDMLGIVEPEQAEEVANRMIEFAKAIKERRLVAEKAGKNDTN